MAGLRTAALIWAVWPFQALAAMRGLLFGWVPVLMAGGIGLWFGLPTEPGLEVYAGGVAVLSLMVAFWMFGPESGQPAAIMVACLVAGFLAIGLRAHLVAAPMLDTPYFGPVQGRIVEIDRSQADALRITLDRVVLRDMAARDTPRMVRISLQGDSAKLEFGQTVLTTARLAAPEGPAEPGGFDFRRMAYFDGLGAVGYTRNPVMLWAEPEPGAQTINRLRMYLSNAIMTAAPSDAGAFASGAMTGDRSGINRETVQALRDSNLAHLLAISGMNMAFLTAFVFMLLRYGLALIPAVALRINTKKVAAMVAFGVALFYLLLSGSNVATERAFLMVSVMLGAVVLDRRALTMRSVALSACVLLLWQPESLAEPGFQLSFAATVVLIAGFGFLDRKVMREKLPRWVLPVFTLVLSSVLAGAATAPYAAATFNRFTDYGLLANLLTVPMMSVLMAAGAVAVLLAPLGLAMPAIWVMEQAARWILFVAHWVAGLEGAVTPVIAPGPWVIPLISLAGCWAVLMTRGRALALLPLVAAFGLWFDTERPTILISGDGAVVGLLSTKGRAISKTKGAGFSVETWLQKDGTLIGQAEAALLPGFAGPPTARTFETEGFKATILTGKTALAAFAQACATSDLVIIGAEDIAPAQIPAGCTVIDRQLLLQTGALAIHPGKAGSQIIASRRGTRIWMGQKPAVNLPALPGQ